MPCEDHEVDFHFFVGPDGLMAFAGGLPSTMAAFAVCAWAPGCPGETAQVSTFGRPDTRGFHAR